MDKSCFTELIDLAWVASCQYFALQSKNADRVMIGYISKLKSGFCQVGKNFVEVWVYALSVGNFLSNCVKLQKKITAERRLTS